MRLALQNLTEITKSLRREDNQAGREKRGALRRNVTGRVQVLPVEGTVRVPFSVLLQDISLTGFGMMLSQPLKEGRRFVVILPRADLDPLSILCVSQHCSEMADGLYHVGAAFEQIVPHGNGGHVPKEAPGMAGFLRQPDTYSPAESNL
jgi:hypothetical protein